MNCRDTCKRHRNLQHWHLVVLDFQNNMSMSFNVFYTYGTFALNLLG